MENGILHESNSDAVTRVVAGPADRIAGRAKTAGGAATTRATTTAVLLGAFLFCYAGVFYALAGQWWNSTVYSYGFLVPFISGYIVWQRRETIFTTAPAPAWFSGGGLLMTGLLLFAFGHAGGILTLQQLSLMVTLMGLVLFFMGGAYLRRLSLPIHYLWLMIPVWDAFTQRLHLPFQNLSANLGVMLLQRVGVPVYQDGLYIYLPNITLEVAQACSGVNYLIAVIAIGIPLGYLFLHRPAARVALVVFGLVVAALSNSLRVGLIGVLSYYNLSGDLHGPFHTLQGMFVSVIGYGALFWGLRFLMKRQGPAPTPTGLMFSAYPSARRAIPVCALLLVTGGYGLFFSPTPVPLSRDFAEFPMQVGSWQGRDVPPEEGFAHLDADHVLSRVYQNAEGDRVLLYVAYFESQAQGRELAGQATQALDAGATPVTLHVGSETPMDVNQRIVRKAGQGQITLFWYDVGGQTRLSRGQVKLTTAWRALTRAEAAGALIAFEMNLDDPGQIPRQFAAEEDLIRYIHPLLHEYLP
jgi:EpsI family protein